MSTSDEHRDFVRLLFERHGAALKRHVIGRLGRTPDAEDIVQETMSRLLDHEDLERHEAQARSYMYRTATNLVYDHYHWRREESLDDPALACRQAELVEPDAIVDLDLALEAITRTRIVPASFARAEPTRILQQDDSRVSDHEIVTRTIPNPDGYEAPQLVPVLRPMMPQAAMLGAVPNTNTLVIVDYYDNVRRITTLIEQIVGERD